MGQPQSRPQISKQAFLDSFPTFRKIVVLSGAGISVAAGIPDFRSPDGLYAKLKSLGHNDPTKVFDLGYFCQNPQLFYTVAQQLYRPDLEPTAAHRFIKQLDDRGQLLRHYTQNVDMLDDKAGLPSSKLREAHGSMRAAHCAYCGKEASLALVVQHIQSGWVPRCECGGPIKPDIVFFGEPLDHRLLAGATTDLLECDLVLVMGTSMQVYPFATLLNQVPDSVPVVVLNNESIDIPSSLELIGDIQETIVLFQ